MNLVSIIIPVYNKERHLSETIETVKNQTYQNFEIVFADDCSSDASVKVIKESMKGYEDKYKLLIADKNSGAAAARNAGIKAAEGRFLCFLDADDLWKEEKLERQTRFMLDNAYSFTFTDYEYAKRDGGGTGIVTNIPGCMDYHKSLKNTVIFTSTVMIDLRQIRKDDIMMPDVPYEDTAAWRSILKKHGKAYGLKENLTLYRRPGHSLSSNKLAGMKRSWNLYRKVEKLSVFKSAYYFSFYAANAALRRIRFPVRRK